MSNVYTDVLSLCTCGHYAFSHVANGGKPRKACTHQDDKGKCPCRKFSTVDNPVDGAS